MNRKPIFDAVRRMLARGFTPGEVAVLDAVLDGKPGLPPAGRTVGIPRKTGAAGLTLIRTWEGCARRLPDGTYAAYPDPGSAGGHPWTIGWGATGPDIGPGLTWTQAQCDARLEADLAKYAREVEDFLDEADTTQNQFDALVSFHYNTGAIRTATLGRLHKAGRFAEAQAEFGRWIYNDGKPMNGLRARRAVEARLYAKA